MVVNEPCHVLRVTQELLNDKQQLVLLSNSCAHAEVIKLFSKPRIPNNTRATGEGIIVLNSRVTKQLNNRRAGH